MDEPLAIDLPRRLLGRLTQHLQSKTAPVLASYLPARYYAVYRQQMARHAAMLPPFADLPRTTLEEGYAPLLIRPVGGVEPPGTVLHALTKSSRLLVLGVAGAGKSTLLRYLAWYFTRHQDASFVQHLTFRLFGQAMDELMPLLLDLGAWAGSGADLEQALLSTLAAHGFPASGAYLRHRLEAGQCLLLLDDLDHLHTSAQRAQVARLAATYPQNIWVVTSRVLRPLPDLPGFGTYQLQGMDATQLPEFIRHNLGRASPESAGLLAACERYEGLARLAQIPLLNASMCHALQHQMVQTVTIPPLLDACLMTLLDGDGMPDDSDRKGGHLDGVRLLQRIAYQMQAQERDQTNYNEIIRLAREQHPDADLQALVSLGDELIWQAGILQPCESGEAYSFAMPALQSYLAASWIVAEGQVASLIPLADTPWWRETITFTAGLLPDATAFVRELAARARREPDKWFLLADCVAEARACAPSLRQDISRQLMALLKNESSVCWQPAIQALAGMAGRRVQEHLGLLLQDRQAETRHLAALTLGRLQQEWAIPALDAALTDPQMIVRQQAAWALGRIPSAQAVRVLTRALHSSFEGVPQGAVQALAALGRMPDLLPAVTQQLVPLLSPCDCQPTHVIVTNLAEQVLLEIGHPALAELIAKMSDRRLEPQQRFRLARVVGQLGDERALVTLVDALLHGDGDDLEGYLQAIACLGDRAVPALLAALEGHNATTGATLMMALARIGSPAVELLVDALAEDSGMREIAVCALEQIGAPAVEPLVRVLLHDARADVRKRALEILRHVGDASSVRLLADATQSGDLDTRLSAVRYLGELGQADALQPLVGLLETGGDIALRRAALTSLGVLGDAHTIPALLATLRDPSLRETAVDVLARFGETAVEPLIRQLHVPDADAEVRQAAWSALNKIGARPPADGGRWMALAATYARLRDERLDAGEMLAWTRRLSWWKHGAELHYSLSAAHALAEAADMEAIAESDSHLDWLAGQEEWLRPQIKDILWGLADIIANIQFCRKMSRRDSQREALLACLERLQGLEQRLPTCLPFERTLLGEVVRQWRAVLTQALDQLRGQASLFIELLTPTLLLHDSQHIATAVFQLFNEGDSPARNLSVAIRPGPLSGAQVLGGEQRELDPLGVGEERHLEVNIAPNGTERAEVLFEARYDDEERKGVVHRFSCQLAFADVSNVYVPIESSPYIAGTPVKTPEMFFGRQEVFDWVRESIQGKQQNALVLYGERRMGKTSLLYQLQRKPPTPQHLPLLFDLQLYSYIHTLQELLWELGQAILARLARAGVALEGPDRQAYEENPFHAFVGFCDLLNSRLGDQRLVVMMDEFGALLAQIRDGVLDASILDFIRGIIQRTSRLTFLFTGAVEMRRLQHELRSTLFNTAKVYRISYLSPGEATELITRPVEGLLTFHPLVIHRICEVTACHPYFIQYICDDLVQLARAEHKNYLEPGDLDYVLREVVQDATGNIEGNIYHFLNGAERAALAALAAITDEVRVFVPLEDIAAMLERRRLSLPRSRLMRALQGLQERELVAERRIGQQLYYAFRMGLVRMWLRQNEILLRLSQEQQQ